MQAHTMDYNAHKRDRVFTGSELRPIVHASTIRRVSWLASAMVRTTMLVRNEPNPAIMAVWALGPTPTPVRNEPNPADMAVENRGPLPTPVRNEPNSPLRTLLEATNEPTRRSQRPAPRRNEPNPSQGLHNSGLGRRGSGGQPRGRRNEPNPPDGSPAPGVPTRSGPALARWSGSDGVGMMGGNASLYRRG